MTDFSNRPPAPSGHLVPREGAPSPAAHDVWREVRGGLPAQDVHLPESAVGPAFHLDESDHWLGRIAIYYTAHPTIPYLRQACFDYAEPWDWSRETEHVATGLWVRGSGGLGNGGLGYADDE